MFSKPFDALDDLRGKKVVVERRNSATLVGVLEAFDKHINMAFSDAQVILPEYEGKDVDFRSEDYETFFQRGSEILDVKPLTDDVAFSEVV